MILDAQDTPNEGSEYMRLFLQEHTASLKKILCVYVLRMGLARGEAARLVTDEVFQDTVVEVMAHSKRFMSIEQPRPWFLAVAINVLKRKRASFARRYRFEVLMSDLVADADAPDEADFWEQIAISAGPGPEQLFESHQQVEEMLALVSPDDAKVLRLVLFDDLAFPALAERLGVSIGAARVRLHRALKRLRKVWIQQQEHERKERS